MKEKTLKGSPYFYPLLIILTGVIVRILYFTFEKSSPLFLYPIVDEREYVRIATYISENSPVYPYHFWHPPLYSYFLGFLKFLGFHLQGILIIQQGLGVLGALLLYYAIKSYHRNFALVSALIWIVYPVQLFIETKFLAENLYIFLGLLLFFVLSKHSKTNKALLWTGVISGLLIITKSQFLLFVVAWFFVIRFRQKQTFKKAFLYLGIAMVFPLAVSLHNTVRTGTFIFVSSNGPTNFYLGNSSDIQSTLNIRPKEWKSNFFPSLYDDAGIYFEKDSTDPNATYPYKLSGYLIKRTLSENSNLKVPVKNLLLKSFVLLHAYETPRDFDLYEYRSWNRYLKLSLHDKRLCFPLALLFYASLIFVFVAWKKIRQSELLFLGVLLLVVNLLPSIIFFNAFRYRLAAVPYIITFAVMFYQAYFKNIRLQLIHLLMIIIFGSSLFSRYLIQKIPKVETYDFYADGFFEKGKVRTAERYYKLATGGGRKEALPGKSSHDAFFQQAYIAEQGGKLDEAIEYYTKAIEADSTSSIAYYNRATVKYKKGVYGKALEDYSHALMFIAPDDVNSAPVYYGRGLTLIRLNKLEKAMADFDMTIEMDPEHGKAYANRGLLKARLGNIEEALVDFDKAIEFDPGNPKTYNDRGIARVNLNDFEGALADFSMAIQLHPDYAEAYFLRGMLYNQTGEHEKACADLNKAAQMGHSGAIQQYQRNCK